MNSKALLFTGNRESLAKDHRQNIIGEMSEVLRFRIDPFLARRTTRNHDTVPPCAIAGSSSRNVVQLCRHNSDLAAASIFAFVGLSIAADYKPPWKRVSTLEQGVLHPSLYSFDFQTA